MYLLFDVGGTNTRIAFTRDGKNFDRPRVFATPKDFNDALRLFREASYGKKIKAAGGGVPGPLDRAKAKILNAPNLDGWNKKPLKKELAKILKTPVYLENDAALCGLGEAYFGAGKNKKIVAYLTIGTGVGGARIVNGHIDANIYGFEPGHQFICFEAGRDLESYISGRSLKKQYKREPSQITDQKVREEVSRYLAYGLANTIVHWSPEIVILGGAVTKMLPLARIQFHLRQIVKIFPEIPPVRKGRLGDNAGLYGALIFLKQNLTPIT